MRKRGEPSMNEPETYHPDSENGPTAQELLSAILERAQRISAREGDDLFMPFEIWQQAEAEIRKEYGMPQCPGQQRRDDPHAGQGT